MNYTLCFWIINAFTAVLRLLVIGKIGLSGDEAHYWTYTQYLDLSYFDHPPLIAYIIKIFTLMFGDTEFAVRLPTVLIFFVTSWLVFLLAKKMFGEKVAFWSVALLNVTPVFSFLGAVMTIPDAPLAFFWIVFVYLFWKIVDEGKGWYWYPMGLVLGFGLLSKYNAILLVPSACLFLLLSPKHRFWFYRKEPYIALAIAFAVFSPVVLWNMENSWVSFGFQLKHGFGHSAPRFSFTLLGRCLSAQAGYLSPILFFVYWTVLFRLGRQFIRQRDDKSLLLFSFSFPTLFLFNAIACFNEILPHWPAMGYLVLSIGVVYYAVEWWTKTWFRVVLLTGAALSLALTVLVPLQAMYKLLPPELFLPAAEAQRLEDGITRAEKVDVTNELYGWREAGREIAAILERSPDQKPFIFTHRHYVASQLSFYTPSHPRIYCLSDRIDAYDLWQRDLQPLDGRGGIFVTNDYFYVEPETIFPFQSWQKHDPLPVFRNGRKIRLFWLTEGRKFDLKALPPDYTDAALGKRLKPLEAMRKLDYDLFWLINRKAHTKIVDIFVGTVVNTDTSLGVNTSLVFLLVLIAAILWNVRRAQFWPEFILAIGVIAVGGIIVHFLKDLFCTPRPLAVFGDQVFTFKERLSRCSFPSGHTQIAFGVAAYLTSRVRKYWWAFFGLALAIGLSRIYVGSHFPSDVLGGAVLGAAVSFVMVKLIRID
jgi:membrane-associated phospholipid phosphatase